MAAAAVGVAAKHAAKHAGTAPHPAPPHPVKSRACARARGARRRQAHEMSRTPNKRSRYTPCNAPLSLGYSLRMRARICNASKRTELQLRQLPGAFPSVRQAEEPPPETLSASQWPTAALLWLCMWHANYTLLHIPKTVHLASLVACLPCNPSAFHAFAGRAEHRARRPQSTRLVV